MRRCEAQVYFLLLLLLLLMLLLLLLLLLRRVHCEREIVLLAVYFVVSLDMPLACARPMLSLDMCSDTPLCRCIRTKSCRAFLYRRCTSLQLCRACVIRNVMLAP